jgi:hypothetical protein
MAWDLPALDLKRPKISKCRMSYHSQSMLSKYMTYCAFTKYYLQSTFSNVKKVTIPYILVMFLNFQNSSEKCCKYLNVGQSFLNTFFFFL